MDNDVSNNLSGGGAGTPFFSGKHKQSCNHPGNTVYRGGGTLALSHKLFSEQKKIRR